MNHHRHELPGYPRQEQEFESAFEGVVNALNKAEGHEKIDALQGLQASWQLT